MMAGQDLNESSDEDRDFLVDLGLLRRENNGGLTIAHPIIYREILVRVLTQGLQDTGTSGYRDLRIAWINVSSG